MGRIAVVDANDHFVRWATRAEVHEQHLVHRSIHVTVLHPDGRMLLQRRHPDKITYPDHWDVAVAGHVEEQDYPAGPDEALDQVYADVATRELHEELGIHAQLQPDSHSPPVAGVHYEQTRHFFAVHPGPFTLQPEEVVEIRWVTPAQLAAMLDDPATHTTRTLAWRARLLLRAGRWGDPAAGSGA